MPLTKATQNVIAPNICTTDTVQTVTAAKTFTGNVTTSNLVNGTSLCFRNKIINGDMQIDQRNSGASVTQQISNLYPVDRFAIAGTVASKFTAQQNQNSVTPPSGFSKYLGITSSSSYSVAAGDYFYIAQAIEGFNISNLGFGTANASPITLSFWVRSSLTGTFGGSIRNGAATYRSYPFTYTIPSANTWTLISITIPGDTTGTWASDNTAGMWVFLGLGAGSTFSGTAGSWQVGNLVSATGATSVVGTNGATFYITGVQLEAGSVATPFENRPIGTELALCQRYFQKSYDVATNPGTVAGGISYQAAGTGGESAPTVMHLVPLRASPTFVIYSPVTGATGNRRNYTLSTDEGMTGFNVVNTIFHSGSNANHNVGSIYGYHFTASAEL